MMELRWVEDSTNKPGLRLQYRSRVNPTGPTIMGDWADVPTVEDKPKECICKSTKPGQAIKVNFHKDKRATPYCSGCGDIIILPKERTLEEKFFEWDNTYQRESQMRGMAMTSATYLKQLAEIAREHFKQSNDNT